MTTQPMSIKLTKRILMATPDGAYLVSNCFQGFTSQLSIFEEIVSSPQDREQQWERILAAKASQRLCRVFASKVGMARSSHTATLLQNGQVLVAGGNGNGWPPNYLASAEVFNSATGAFSVTGPMSHSREYHTATLLPSGAVLVTGGNSGSGSARDSELYQ